MKKWSLCEKQELTGKNGCVEKWLNVKDISSMENQFLTVKKMTAQYETVISCGKRLLSVKNDT